MGASDGSVGGVVKIVDHGPDSSRWNLAILGDGYRAGELAQYHSDVQQFVDTLRATPPYDELWCGINVHRIDVTSTDSGADNPMTAECPGGTGTTARTFFDATFCSAWGSTHLERLLTVDSTRAKAAALAAVHPAVHQTLVIVNSSKYGGSGGSVATCSTHASSAQIAIHEIGHSAYGLADEYEDGNAPIAGEPPEPNVTRDTNRATNKWRDLILATTPMPTSCYGDCPGCTGPVTPPPAGTVGVYQGARYSHCEFFRPLPSCYMRDYGPFCPVCARVIRQTLAPFLPPESITLTTPSLSFTDIPEGIGGTGVTTYRAVVLEVATCRRLHFRITAGPTGGFGTPLGTTTDAGPGAYGPVDQARLWLSYTSSAAGTTSSGSVTVRCDETGQTWTVPITANTVARPKAAAVLTLDHSGSMAEDAGDGVTKADKLREAAGIFVDAMLPGDGIGLVRFDDTVQRLMDVTDVGALGSGPGRATANGHITGPELDPAGATSIGGGVLEAKQALDDAQATASPPYAVRAIVVLTDGVENTPPTIASAAAGITANTFAIGLGLPSNISVAALDALTQGHHGYLLVTGALDVDQRTRLTKYFLQVLAGITNANVVLDPHGEIGEGEEHDIPFEVTEADYGLDAFVLTPYPQAVEYELEMPDGARIDAASFGVLGTTEMLVRDGAALYRVALPADPGAPLGSHDGTWKVVLRVGRRSPWDRGDTLAAATRRGKDTTPYDVLIHTYSNLVFSAQAVQKTYEPGDVVRLYASLREYDVPVANRAGVWAEIVDPDGNQSVVTLKLGPNDQFAGSFHTSVPGLYRVRVRARGETFAGSAFSREQTTSAFALPGGDRTPDTGGDDRLAQLVCCVLHSKQGLACIKRLGGDELLRCVRRLCAPSRRSD